MSSCSFEHLDVWICVVLKDFWQNNIHIHQLSSVSAYAPQNAEKNAVSDLLKLCRCSTVQVALLWRVWDEGRTAGRFFKKRSYSSRLVTKSGNGTRQLESCTCQATLSDIK
eukprot:s2441_g7.t1